VTLETYLLVNFSLSGIFGFYMNVVRWKCW